jgi:hypothetical protein
MDRLKLLVRRNKGRTEHSYYATELSHVLKTEVRPVDILDLEETDRLFSHYCDQAHRSSKELGFAFRKVWKYDPTAPWLASCRCLEEKLRGEPAVLFAGPYEFCGGVKVDLDRALRAVASILEFDRDTVQLESPSSESGLFLDLFEEKSDRLIELAVWGDWKTAAGGCV